VLRLALSSVVLSGPGSVERLGMALRTQGIRAVFVVSGSHTSETPVARRARASMTAGGIRVVERVRDAAVPTIAEAEALSIDIERSAVGAVVAIGGGSVIDLAKVALITTAEGRPAERHAVTYRPGQDPELPHLTAAKLPLAAIPTTFSGSEGNGSGLMRGGTERFTRSFRDDAVAPSLVVLDPIAGAGQEPRTAVASALNAIAHGVDALYSRHRSPFSDALATESLQTLFRVLPALALAPDDPHARTDAQWASLLGGIAIRHAYVGAHHAIAHALVSCAHLRHDIAHAVVLPATIAWHLAHLPPSESERLAARLPHDWEAALRGASASVHLPASLREAGVPGDALESLADEALHDRGTGNEIIPIARDEVLAILGHAWTEHAPHF
jgi:alcohol dehydrogenase class IV